MDVPPAPKRKFGLVRITLWTLVACFGFLLFSEGINTSKLKAQARKAAALAQVQQLASASNQYRTEYGFQPSGGNAEIIKALRGDNPRKIVFYEGRDRDFNEQGEIIDSWRRPLLFELQDGKEPWIRSIGPDGKDDVGASGSDDIVNRKIK